MVRMVQMVQMVLWDTRTVCENAVSRNEGFPKTRALQKRGLSERNASQSATALNRAT
jgi:hypothetical protein